MFLMRELFSKKKKNHVLIYENKNEKKNEVYFSMGINQYSSIIDNLN